MKLSKFYTINSGDFNIAWLTAMNNVLKSDTDVIFGSAEEPKYIKDSCQGISLTGNAIDQISSGTLHPDFSFKSVEQYKQEFDVDFLARYNDWPEEKKFTYLYVERIVQYKGKNKTIDQLKVLRDQLEDQINNKIASNRSQAITWEPEVDTISNASPCFQRAWSRWIGEEDEVNYTDLHLDWRSRDLFNAWQPNLIAVTWMMNKYVYGPNNCKIYRLIDKNDSLHIYRGDVELAKSIVEKRLPFRMRY
jgi:thymidylate synthase